MAMTDTWDSPSLDQPIGADLPAIKNKFQALVKGDPSLVQNPPVGAKRLVEIDSGNWQVQQYNGSTWSNLGKLKMDVDTVDGYHAAITPQADTIAVRNASGKLEGDITGNAASADSAATLSNPLGVELGGTGAKTAAQARTNLGVPPTSHGSTDATYGVGNASQYGHLKLSDATDSASGTAGGIAASPAAVKAAKDAADDAMEKASTLATEANPGIAYFPAPFTIGADGKAGIRAATTGQTGIVQLNDTVTSTSTTQAATANAAKAAYDKAVEAASKAGLPLGYIYAWPYSTPMDGSIQINGQMLNRDLYADLFAYAKSHRQVISEAEWQEKAGQQGGYCAFYSEGDGSTTFRAPKFAPYQKFTMVSSDAGKYYEAGLPGITGDIDAGYGGNSQYLGLFNSGSGCFKTSGNYNQRYPSPLAGGANYTGMSFDASGSDKTYGNSDTVRPESMDWIVCVVAFGVATNVGSVDVVNVVSAVGQVQSEVEEVRTIAEESAARLDPRLLGTRSTAGVMTITGATIGRILVVGIKRKDAIADDQYAAFSMKSGTRFSYGTQSSATGAEMRIGKSSGGRSDPSTYIDIISSSTVVIDFKTIANSASPVSVYEV